MSRRPQKIDVKIGSPDMVLWTDVVDRLSKGIENAEQELRINQTFLETAKSELKIAELEFAKP